MADTPNTDPKAEILAAVMDQLPFIPYSNDEAAQAAKAANQKRIDRYISNSIKAVNNYVGADELPTALTFIVENMTLAKFNKVGNEGMAQYSEEGQAITFSTNDLQPYYTELDRYMDNQEAKEAASDGGFFFWVD
ncbi:phage head-tail connector protein [Enterococcus faecium]